MARQLFFVYDAESPLPCAPRILFRPLRLLRISFSVCSFCRLTPLLSPLFSFPFLFPSFLFYFFPLPSRFCSTSLFLGYSTIRPPADIKLHKQRDAPKGLFALQQIFSDCSQAKPYVRCTRRALRDALLKFKGEQYGAY